MHTLGHFSRCGVYSEDCARYEHSPPALTSPFPSTPRWTPQQGRRAQNGKRTDLDDRGHEARNAQRRAGCAPRPSGRGLRTGCQERQARLGRRTRGLPLQDTRRHRPGGEAVARPTGGRVGATLHYPHAGSEYPPGELPPDISAPFGPKACTFRTDFPENGRIRVSGGPKGVDSMVRIDARFSFLSHACTSGAGPPNRG
jgi:hypothetical protein